MIMDDGVTTRLAEDHFHATTIGGAAGVLDWMGITADGMAGTRYICLGDRGTVRATLSGPNAEILEAAGVDIDLSASSFPFIDAEAHLGGCRCDSSGFPYRRAVLRINVKARHGWRWTLLMEAGVGTLVPRRSRVRAEKGSSCWPGNRWQSRRGILAWTGSCPTQSPISLVNARLPEPQ